MRAVITRMSELFLRTLRDDPADAEVASHKLLIRAGYVRFSAGKISGPPWAERCAGVRPAGPAQSREAKAGVVSPPTFSPVTRYTVRRAMDTAWSANRS